MLAGHKSRITVITLGKIEVEGVASHENMVLTASDAGEAIMWDIIDGRCLQAAPNAFEGSITAMKDSLTWNAEAKYVDRIYYTTLSGELCTSTIDEQALSQVPEHTQAIERAAPSVSAALEVNRYDNSLAMLVEANCCSVFKALGYA
ncbi:hypothetical protein HDU86_002043 [Geranomyces michiganensis]|nr:hypothetical protein HDU86_002043 [Geranomyces michiganensis]